MRNLSSRYLRFCDFGNIENNLINFEFKERRKFLSLEDKVSGVKVTIKGTTITVAVPNNIYRANVEGLGQSYIISFLFFD